jgi:hypothetical protein
MRKDAMLVGLRPCLQAKRSDPNGTSERLTGFSNLSYPLSL